MIAAARRFGNNRPCLTIETRTSVKARKTPVLRRYPVQVTVSQPFGRAAASAARSARRIASSHWLTPPTLPAVRGLTREPV